jgi:hypothetical protein
MYVCVMELGMAGSGRQREREGLQRTACQISGAGKPLQKELVLEQQLLFRARFSQEGL